MQELGIHSDSSSAHRTVAALPDLAKITEKQQIVAKATADVASAVSVYRQNQLAKAQEALSNAETELMGATFSGNQSDIDAAQGRLNEARENVKAWETGGRKVRALNAGTTLITGILGGQSEIQAAVNSASPYTAQLIGQTFGQNGSHPNEALQLLAHAVNSGVLAVVNGGSFEAGAVSGAGSELAAKAITQTLFGEEAAANPSILGEQEKTLVSDLSAVFGTVSGGLAGGSALNAQIGAAAGQNAVENNYLLPKDWSKYHQEIAQCQGKGARCYTKAAKALEEISKRRNRELAQACSVYGSIEACTAKQNEAKQSVAYTKQQLAAIPSGLGKPSSPILQYLDKVGADHPISDGLIAVNRLKQMDALAASPEFIKAYQSDAKVRKDFKNQVESLASIVQQSGRAKEGFMFDKEVPLTNISKLGGIRTGEVGLIPVYPEFELMGLGIGKATKTVAVKLLGNKSLKVGGREFSQTLGQRVMSTVDGEMAGGNKLIKSPNGDYVLPIGKQTIDPTRTSFSQATVSYQKRGTDYNYDSIVTEMKKQNKWIGEPVDVVNMPDRAPTSLDNTRILAAREAGLRLKRMFIILMTLFQLNVPEPFSTRENCPKLGRSCSI
ncbi:VENN motif pre-toxin domain-containing protein [Neisseria weixii]|uniref:VENN motif pre-toxin domain-containing protein n=1 Tax=Neisseria weixii TaxID=1853276 RepID=UPI0022B76CA0|nr:VENN motif pre-toxin domain-containing protein [Neisseria weixii]